MPNCHNVTGWVSVEDRLPEKQMRVLVRCNPGGTVVGWLLWDGWMTDFGNAYNGNGEVTHWMPLPEPPKEADYG